MRQKWLQGDSDEKRTVWAGNCTTKEDQGVPSLFLFVGIMAIFKSVFGGLFILTASLSLV